MRSEMDKMQALKKAQSICARQETCRWEIEMRLFRWKVDKQLHSQIIELLVKENYIDEKRYTSFFVKDKFRLNKWGKIKIEHELKSKHIQDEIIQDELDIIDDEDYRETCISLLNNKLSTLKDFSFYEAKGKLIRFACSRGFETDLVIKLAENLLHENKMQADSC